MAELAGYNGGWLPYGSSAQYAGNYGSRYTAIARAEAPPRVESVTFRLSASGFRPSGGQPVLRWALCSSDANRDSYIAPGQVEEEYQLASGTITFTASALELTIPCTHEGMVYLILWSYSTATAYRVTLLSAEESWAVKSLFAVTATADPGAVLTVSPSGQLEYGTEVTVTAAARPGYRLTGVTLNGQPLETGRFSVQSDTVIHAAAALRAYRLGSSAVRVFIGNAPYAPYIGSPSGTPTPL